jgi:hypothetical protein
MDVVVGHLLAAARRATCEYSFIRPPMIGRCACEDTTGGRHRRRWPVTGGDEPLPRCCASGLLARQAGW